MPTIAELSHEFASPLDAYYGSKYLYFERLAYLALRETKEEMGLEPQKAIGRIAYSYDSTILCPVLELMKDWLEADTRRSINMHKHGINPESLDLLQSWVIES